MCAAMKDGDSQAAAERRIREFLKQEEITNLDELITRAAVQAAKGDASAQPLWMRPDTDASIRRPAKPIVHPPPQAELFIDGQAHDPSHITEFNGQPLYSTAGMSTKREPVMYAFTTKAALHAHLIRPHAPSDWATDPNSLGPTANFYQDTYLQGDRLSLDAFRQFPDLTDVHRGAFHLQDWNDIISSVDWCRWDIFLYEDINFHGSNLHIAAGLAPRNLVEWGWNDRASALMNVGYRL